MTVGAQEGLGGWYGDEALTVRSEWEEQGGEPWSGEDV